MAKGVSAAAVQRQRRTHAHRGHHVANLADDMVGQQPANVVLQDGIDHAVKGHHHAGPQQHLGAREEADKHVYRGLGGEGAQEHAAGNRGFRVGIRQPGVQRRHRGVNDDAQKNEPEGRARRFALCQSRQAGFTAVQQVDQNAAEQQRAAQNMDQQIAVPGRLRLRRAPEPHHEQ